MFGEVIVQGAIAEPDVEDFHARFEFEFARDEVHLGDLGGFEIAGVSPVGAGVEEVFAQDGLKEVVSCGGEEMVNLLMCMK